MSIIQSRVVVRDARQSDYQAVLDIHPDLWGGAADYMSLAYPEYMANPMASTTVAEVDGQVVAFYVIFLVDEKTALLAGARTAAKFGGQGIMLRLSTESVSLFKQRFPHVDKFITSAIDSRVHDAHRHNKPPNLHIVTEMHFLHYETSSSTAEQLVKHTKDLRPDSLHTSKVINFKGINEILHKENNFKNFFPEPYFLHGQQWIPLATNVNNIRRVQASSGTQYACSFSNKDLKYTGVSFASLLEAPKGIYVGVYMHITDEESLFSHINTHLESKLSLFSKHAPCTIELFFPMSLDISSVKRCLFPVLGCNVISNEIPRERAIIMEKLISKL